MPKRNDHLLTLLMAESWWVSVIFAAVVYIAFAYIAPILLVEINVLGEGLAQTSVTIAPYFGSIFLIPAALSLLRCLLTKRSNTR
ncbi:hypothetical protein VV869_17635 [Photobacterium sp. MCCC 1A19761]|uniref:hypothetical protein n=1 Tax=Photobacterium sp. MCCC 1A19761 TaxID=3115000 RepID=UPI00307F6D89